MVNSHYTLKALLDEIHGDLESSVIEACYTRVEHTLEIIAAKPGEQSYVIVVSCKPRANYMFLRAAPRRHTGANVLHDAVGRTILSVEVIRNERTVVLHLSNRKSLAVNLFGPHANVHLLGAEGEVSDSFLKVKHGFVLPSGSNKQTGANEAPEQFISAFKAAAGSPLQRLGSLIPPFGGELGREAFFRSGGKEFVTAARDKNAIPDDGAILGLCRVLALMMDELSRPAPRIYYEDDDPIMMSLIEMRHLDNIREESFNSVNLCIAAFSAVAEKQKTEAEIKSDILDRLAKRRDDLVRTIGKIDEDLSVDREIKYRRFGDIIMAHLFEIESGAETFRDNDTGESVALDPGRAPAQNAQAYYEKAKKARESRRQATARREELRKLLEKVNVEIEKIGTGTDSGRLAAIAKTERAKEEAQTPFREFEVNGYKIYVGKDAKNNDQLTFGFAKPNDVFLHARGVSGSHVIIRNASRDYPQKAVLEYAARIAAHYSKARTSGIVPVAYTMRKFVKKARGKPGAVFVDREEVIFVKPGIPQPAR